MAATDRLLTRGNALRRSLLACTCLACWLFGGPAAAVPVLGSGTTALPPVKAASAGTPQGAAYQRGIEAIAKGDERAAEKAFREALVADPRHVPSMLGLAEVEFNGKRIDEAGAWLDKAVNADPKHAAAQAAWGRFLALKGQNKAAEAALRKSVALDSTAFRPHIDLADLLHAGGRLDESIDLYRRAVAIDGRHSGARYALGLALGRKGDLTGATAELRRALDLAPGNPLPHVALARVHLAAKDEGAALAALDQATAIQPTLVDALMLRGDILTSQGRFDPAVAAYEAVIAAAPKLAEAHARKAMVDQQRGRLDAAEAAYKQAISVDPRHAVSLNNLASMALERKLSLSQAESWARQAVDAAPGVGTFHDTLGWIQRARGNLKSAKSSLSKAAELSPKDALIQYHLGVVQAENGDKVRARQSLKASLSLSDKSPTAQAARELLASLGGS